MREYINFISFLDKKNKQRLLIFIVLMISTVVLEILSISLILPFLHLFIQNEIPSVLTKYLFKIIDYQFFFSKDDLKLIAILLLLSTDKYIGSILFFFE